MEGGLITWEPGQPWGALGRLGESLGSPVYGSPVQDSLRELSSAGTVLSWPGSFLSATEETVFGLQGSSSPAE